MRNIIWLPIFIFSLYATLSTAQSFEYEVKLEPISIDGLGGIQSYVFGQYDGKWLIAGGRLDGLHRRQPWASFDEAGNNKKLWVIDPINKTQWSTNINELSIDIQEQLSSTNMEFFQKEDYLYCIGGYGYSPSKDEHITYAKILAIDLAEIIPAIMENNDISGMVRQFDEPEFQITGGKIKKMNGAFYLLGGQTFTGRYNPMGPDHGPGFEQDYYNAIQEFTIEDDGINLSVDFGEKYVDTVNLHRRDYNAEVQIMPDGEQGLTMFSGVFQYDANLPFLDCVNIDGNGYEVQEDFQQYFNHYHCPTLPLYSEDDNKMYTLFFGGIAQFYEEDGVLVQDDNVPFVKTIAVVERDENGTMTEYRLESEMPDYLGASAEFIPLDLDSYDNQVVEMDEFQNDTIVAGYIFGGIESTDANIFWINDGTQSKASSVLYRVKLYKKTVAVEETLSSWVEQPIFYPNPASKLINVKLHLEKVQDVTVTIVDQNGKAVYEKVHKNVKAAPHIFTFPLPELDYDMVYYLQLETEGDHHVQKLIINY